MFRTVTICAVFAICFVGCKVFRDRDNKKFRLWGLVGDNRNGLPQQEIDTIASFRLDSFIAAAIQQSGSVQHVSQEDIELLKTRYPSFVFITWYPTCSSSTKSIKFAERLDSAGVPYLLASLSYDFKAIAAYFKSAKIRNKIMYIVPSGGRYSRKIVIKQNQLLKAICPTCYEEYRDELIGAQAIYFQKGQPPLTLFDFNNVVFDKVNQ